MQYQLSGGLIGAKPKSGDLGMRVSKKMKESTQ